MKLTILGSGTSQGVPVIACQCPVCQSADKHDKRLRTSAMLSFGNKNIIIDAGPDFRQQMLRAKVQDIEAILLTHNHKDHTGGLDDIRAFNWIHKKAIPVYANAKTCQSIRNDYSYVFAENKYPGIPEIDLREIDETPFYIGDVKIEPLRVLHHSLEVMGYRFGKFAYITDANHIPESTMKRMEGVEFLVINALRKEPHLSHFTLNQAIEIAQRLQVRHAWLTHIGHQMGFAAEVSKELPENISLAYDTQEIDLKI